MKIQLSDIIPDMRGKQGGAVYKAGKYGLQKQSKSIPRQQNRQLVKNVFGNFSIKWKQLTPDQRLAWNEFAPQFPFTDIFGNSHNLTGFNLFVKCNINNAVAGGNGLLLPVIPSLASLSTIPTISAIRVTGQINFTKTLPNLPTSIFCIYGSVVRPAHQKFFPKQFKVVKSAFVFSTPPAFFNLAPKYEELYGQAWKQKAGAKLYWLTPQIHKESGFIIRTHSIITTIV